MAHLSRPGPIMGALAGLGVVGALGDLIVPLIGMCTPRVRSQALPGTYHSRRDSAFRSLRYVRRDHMGKKLAKGYGSPGYFVVRRNQRGLPGDQYGRGAAHETGYEGRIGRQVHEAKGKLKEKVGQVTNNPNMTTEGQGEEVGRQGPKETRALKRCLRSLPPRRCTP